MTCRACILSVCLVAATVGCTLSTETPATHTSTSPQNAFSYDKQVGIASRQGASVGCLAIFNDALQPGVKVVLADQPPEGVHFQVWTGVPLEGRGRWHWYVYAGYDLEYNCTEKDYFGPK
jgi:hypothetical protein